MKAVNNKGELLQTGGGSSGSISVTVGGVIGEDGQLTNAKTTLYTFAAAGAFKMTLVNTDGAARTFNIYVNRGGGSRLISAENQSLDAGERAELPWHFMNAGDIVEGDASVTTVVDYSIDGVEL